MKYQYPGYAGIVVFLLALALLTTTILFAFSGCSKSNPSASASFLKMSDCKNFGTIILRGADDPAKDIVEFSYQDQVLSIERINGGFNCCTEIDVSVDLSNQLIIIYERENLVDGGCRCLCLYDFEYEIRGISPGEYKLRIEEPYRNVSDPLIEFDVNLEPGTSGSFEVPRNYYPWGEDAGPSGSISGHSDCGGYNDYDNREASDSESCAVFVYDGSGNLDIRHTNCVLNCCPVIAADYSITEDEIIIWQLDSVLNGGCDCICAFDIDHSFVNISPGTYTIKIYEPPYDEEYNNIIFEADLNQAASGQYCIPRPDLPLP